MEIVDYYQFPSGTYVSSTQFIPSSLPCPKGIDGSIHGFIVCAVMLDPDPSQSDRATDEFWIFHADDLKNKPVYRLSASSKDEPLNLAMTIHSTWVPDIRQQQCSAEERRQRRQKSVKQDYLHLIEKKCKAVQELFYDIVFPYFTEQTLEENFEKFLLHKDRPYTFEDWKGGARSLQQEFDYLIDDIEGEIPPELNGTLFRNGPGLLDVNGQQLHHPWDGDGMICAITFSQGQAHFRNRFIETEGYLAERTAKRMLYRGVFGTQKPGGLLANAFDLRLKNIANTQVIYWGEKLLALWEAANPYRLNPRTLETLGIETFDGLLRKGSPIAAHPKIDPGNSAQASRLVAFAINAGLLSRLCWS